MKPLEIHVLNVGHGDCCIIKHASGRITMIDINNGQKFDPLTLTELKAAKMIRKSELAALRQQANLLGQAFDGSSLSYGGYAAELTDPIAYMKAHFPGERVFRFILTHPDADHFRGITRLVNEIGIDNFWTTNHNIKKSGFQSEEDKQDWLTCKSLAEGNGPCVYKHSRAARGKYWNMDDEGCVGDGWDVLAPTPALAVAANHAEDPNSHSYVLRLGYNGFVMIFGGDATEAVLDDVVATYQPAALEANIYKAAHHGRESGYSLAMAQAVQATYTLVSVGKKPDTDVSNRYRYHAKKEVWSTRHRGNIVIRVAGDGAYTLEDDAVRERKLEVLNRALGFRSYRAA